MREIKFRAWSELQKAMFTGLDIEKLYMLGGSEDVNIIELALKYDFKNLQWEQFTGLYDKNGTEIYEGDILATGVAGTFMFGFMAFDEQKGRFSFFEKDLQPWGITTGDSANEVIGNIHENPELLK